MGMWIVVILSAIGVFIDAKRLGVKKGVTTEVPAFLDMGALGWALLTLLLWIVALPLYLYCRRFYKNSSAVISP